jgi:hypothetical protein
VRHDKADTFDRTSAPDFAHEALSLRHKQAEPGRASTVTPDRKLRSASACERAAVAPRIPAEGYSRRTRVPRGRAGAWCAGGHSAPREGERYQDTWERRISYIVRRGQRPEPLLPGTVQVETAEAARRGERPGGSECVSGRSLGSRCLPGAREKSGACARGRRTCPRWSS